MWERLLRDQWCHTQTEVLPLYQLPEVLGGRNVELSDIGNRAYGMRDFKVVDPCGNRLAFGEPTSRIG